MKIWMIVAVCAFIFLVCFLLDTLFKHLFPKSKLEKSKTAVRPARRSATFGVILLFVPVVVLLSLESVLSESVPAVPGTASL